MFVQVIEGKCKDTDALHRQMELWQRDLQPGAVGYLGSTSGVTSEGDCIMLARFESEDAAHRNSERPEQSAWWAETSKCFDGPVAFHDCSDVHVMRECETEAHFVQVMEGHVDDIERAHELEDHVAPMLREHRPDLIGSYTAYHGNEFASVAYFTDEGSARAAESTEPPPELATEMATWDQVMKVDRYLDLHDPWLASR